MPELVTPRTFLIAETQLVRPGLNDYLSRTEQGMFMSDVVDHHTKRGVRDIDADILCSFAAKLCYSSLVPGRNPNLTSTRSIEDNLRAVIAQGHHSVLEHIQLTFVTTDCSRVFTHELIRHRAGCAYSQSSGRYIRIDKLRIVLPPEIRDNFPDAVLMPLLRMLEDVAQNVSSRFDWPSLSFSEKKKLTSALRRLLPNGIANEIVWSCNLRALRHILQLRSSRHAEWEIRRVMSQVWSLVKDRYPLFFEDAKVEMVDNLPEITGMSTQPYEQKEGTQ